MIKSSIVIVLLILINLVVSACEQQQDFNIWVENYVKLKQKIDNGESVTVLYLGGSITEGACCAPLKGTNIHGKSYDYTSTSDREQFSWRALTFDWLKKNYEKREGQFKMINAAVGATHSELAAYRLEKQVIKYAPDLLFIEFAINDGGKGYISNDANADKSIYRTMSSIVRRVEKVNPDIAICIPVSTARKLKEGHSLSRKHHIQFANQMHIPHVDIHDVYFNQPLPEGVTRDNVFDGPDNPGSNVHPSPLGHRAYAEGVERTLHKLFSGETIAFSEDVYPFYDDYPNRTNYISAHSITPCGGWQIGVSSEYKIETHVLKDANILIPKIENAPFILEFEGQSVLIWSEYHFAQGNRRGVLEVYIDDKLVKTFTGAEEIKEGKKRMMRLMPIVDNLDTTKKHTLKLIPKNDANGEMLMGFYAICIDAGE
jgi:lysophospholipase L1-like esterase